MEAAVRKEAPPSHDTPDPLLLQPCGAFVTLTISGELRGCIGFFEPVHSLVDAVARAAVKAALDDHRFSPVRPPELHQLRIEISVLSGKVPVNSVADIVIGRDGLYLETGTARGSSSPRSRRSTGGTPGHSSTTSSESAASPPPRSGRPA